MWITALTGAAVLALMGSENQVQAQVPSTGSLVDLEEKYVDVKGVKTRYYEAGKGEPLVLLHGAGFTGSAMADTWVPVIPGFAKRFRVFAPDKLGSGLTGNPLDDKDYNIQGEIEHTYQFIQTLKLGPVHIIGNSRGAGLAFFLAVLHPEVVKTVVIQNSGTASPESGPDNRADALSDCPREPHCAEWACRLRAYSYKADEAFDDAYIKFGCYLADLPKSKEARAKIAAGAGEPLRSQFDEWKEDVHARVRKEGLLQMPVLLYWGKGDPSVMVESGVALYDIIAAKNAKARMLIVNNAGHFHYREYPEEFVQNVTNFIDFWNSQR